jgi:hypothetical protein
MIEGGAGGKLLTWRVVAGPEEWEGDVGAVRIGDHRMDYLTYEGEVSGGRGRVERVAEGEAEVARDGGGFRVRLVGIGEYVVELWLPG